MFVSATIFPGNCIIIRIGVKIHVRCKENSNMGFRIFGARITASQSDAMIIFLCVFSDAILVFLT